MEDPLELNSDTADERAKKAEEAQQLATRLAHEGVLTSLLPRCPECIDSRIAVDYKEGQYVCEDCARVVGRVISEGTEWRSFENDGHSNKGDPDRVGGPEDETLGEMTLGTAIDDDGGMGRAQNRGNLTSQQRNLINGVRKMSGLASKMNINQGVILSRANELYKRTLECKDYTVRKQDAVLAACLYVACRQANVPRTIKEIAAVTEVQTKELNRAFTKIKKLKLYKKDKNEAGTTDSIVARFCAQLKLPIAVTKVANNILERVTAQGLEGSHKPQTVAGAVICLAAQLAGGDKARTLQEISTVSQQAPTTIQNMYKKFYESRLSIVSPADYSQDEVSRLGPSVAGASQAPAPAPRTQRQATKAESSAAAGGARASTSSSSRQLTQQELAAQLLASYHQESQQRAAAAAVPQPRAQHPSASSSSSSSSAYPAPRAPVAPVAPTLQSLAALANRQTQHAPQMPQARQRLPQSVEAPQPPQPPLPPQPPAGSAAYSQEQQRQAQLLLLQLQQQAAQSSAFSIPTQRR